MGLIFVARSAALREWGDDVGLSKHLYKVGYVADAAADPVEAWCGESDWALLKTQAAEIENEDVLIERILRKEKMIDPRHYPRLKGTRGIFKISQKNVENQMVLAKALDGDVTAATARRVMRLKPADFAAYVLLLGQRA
jgi:hypothetical protein